MHRSLASVPLLLLVALGGCSTMYYAAMSQLGWAKADLLANRVQQARDAMNQAHIQLADALPDFEKARSAGGDRAVRYQALRASLDDAQENAALIGKRRAAVETAAQALFGEMQYEIQEAADDAQRARRQQRYDEFRPPYDRLLDAMRGAEAALPPVLTAMRAELAALHAAPATTPPPGVPYADGDQALRSLQLAVALANQYITALETLE